MQSYSHARSEATVFPITGTAALKPRQRHAFVVLEGGATAQHYIAKLRTRREMLLRSRTLVLAAVLVFALSVGALVLTSVTSAVAARRALDQTDTVTIAVRQGDSLWGIAHEHGIAGVDDGRIVSWIEQRNGVSADKLVPGQRLVVPASAA